VADGSAAARASVPAAALRRALIVLTALGVAGTAVELGMERHWKTAVQLIPWYTLAVITAGIVLLVTRPRRKTVWVVRAIVVAVFLSAAFGVFEHVQANYNAGPLDFRYAGRWPTMSLPSRWWAAATNAVGPSPPLVPAVLAQAALCLGLATLHHPALSHESRDEPEVLVRQPVR
jgi:hypothetical protein